MAEDSEMSVLETELTFVKEEYRKFQRHIKDIEVKYKSVLSGSTRNRDGGNMFVTRLKTTIANLFKQQINRCQKSLISLNKDNNYNKVSGMSDDVSCDFLNQQADRLKKQRKSKYRKKENDAMRFHQCIVCDERFLQFNDLDKHRETHIENEILKVPDVDNMEDEADVTNYCEASNDEEDSPKKPCIEKQQQMCDICGKIFGTKSTLQTHIWLHSGEKPFQCDVCHKEFSNKGNLKQHRRIHTGEKPYICDFCGKSFSGNNDLHKHIRIHTGEKPYVCDMCGKSFCQYNTLQVHVRSHTGEKPHKCDVCSKAFSATSTLRCHMLIHTGEKPFNCDICGKAFRKRFHVQKHMKTHSKYSAFVINK